LFQVGGRIDQLDFVYLTHAGKLSTPTYFLISRQKTTTSYMFKNITIIFLFLLLSTSLYINIFPSKKSKDSFDQFSKTSIDGKNQLYCKVQYIITDQSTTYKANNTQVEENKMFLGHEKSDTPCANDIIKKNITKNELIKSLQDSKDLGIFESISQ
jgi:hypothetical protein